MNELLKGAPKYIEYFYSCTLEIIEPRTITLIVIVTRRGKLANATQKKQTLNIYTGVAM